MCQLASAGVHETGHGAEIYKSEILDEWLLNVVVNVVMLKHPQDLIKRQHGLTQ